MSFLQSTGARRKVPGLIRKSFLGSPYAGLIFGHFGSSLHGKCGRVGGTIVVEMKCFYAHSPLGWIWSWSLRREILRGNNHSVFLVFRFSGKRL